MRKDGEWDDKENQEQWEIERIEAERSVMEELADVLDIDPNDIEVVDGDSHKEKKLTNNPTHEDIPGYVLWSNYGTVVIGKELPHTLESLTEEVQKTVGTRIPMDDIWIQRNPYQPGWSVYLRDKHKQFADDYMNGIKAHLDLIKQIMNRNKNPLFPDSGMEWS